MYLQKCEEFSCGSSFRSDSRGNLYKGNVSFMVVGLKSNVSYVIKVSLENELTGHWLKNEFIWCNKSLQKTTFFY